MMFSPAQKDRILLFAYKASLVNTYQENSYKILKRQYKMPQFLDKINPQVSSLCYPYIFSVTAGIYLLV